MRKKKLLSSLPSMEQFGFSHCFSAPIKVMMDCVQSAVFQREMHTTHVLPNCQWAQLFSFFFRFQSKQFNLISSFSAVARFRFNCLCKLAENIVGFVIRSFLWSCVGVNSNYDVGQCSVFELIASIFPNALICFMIRLFDIIFFLNFDFIIIVDSTES
jgi:hypothetical protein